MDFKPKFDKNGRVTNTDHVKKYVLESFKERNIIRNLDHPRTIQEKIAWLMIYNNSNKKTDCADKYKVHDYVKEKLGKDICVPLIKTYNRAEDVNFNELPDSFVIKCNHGWDMNIVVKNKKEADEKDIKDKLSKWMKRNHALDGGQVQYYNIKPIIMVEKLMQDETQQDSLFDYKFWCMNGKPKLYTINTDHGHGNILYYNVETDEIMDLYQVGEIDFVKPKNFDLMREYASKLSKDFKFVRVDFYEVNGQVYLGEMSFTPGACRFKYKDPQDDIRIGNLLELDH